MRETWKVAANLDLRVGGNDVSVETPVTRRGGERGGGMESGCSGQRPEGREAGVARGPNEGVGPGLPAGVAGGTHLCELSPLYCKGLVSGWCGFCTMLSLEGGGAKHAGSPENGGGWECSPGLRRKPGRMAVLPRQWEQPGLAWTPGVLGLGGMRWEDGGWCLVGPHHMSGPEAQVKGALSLGKPVPAQMSHVPGERVVPGVGAGAWTSAGLGLGLGMKRAQQRGLLGGGGHRMGTLPGWG